MAGTDIPNYRTTSVSRAGIEMPESLRYEPQVNHLLDFISRELRR